MDEILNRLDVLEDRLERVLQILEASDQEEWIDSKSFCQATGIKDKFSLNHYMTTGAIPATAIRNIGTAKRPRYRFHRTKAVDQFLNRMAKTTTGAPSKGRCPSPGA